MIGLLKFLFNFSPKIVITAILTGIISGMSSAGLIGVINSAISKGDGERLTVFLAFIGLAGVMLTAGIISKVSLILLAQSAVFELRMSLSRQIVDAPLRFLESYGSPRVLASLIDDVQVLSGTLLGIPALCINLATVIICLIYIGWLSPWVLGAVFLFTLIGVTSYYALLRTAWNYLRQAREIQNSLFGDFRALTQGTKELKLHRGRRTAFFADELQTNATNYRSFGTKGAQIYAGADSWGQFLFIFLIGSTLFVLPFLTQVNSTVLTGYILALLYIMVPLEVLINFFPNISRAQISLEQIKSLGLTLSEEKLEKKEEKNFADQPFQKIELIEAQYTYQTAVDEKPFTIGPTNLEINAGEVIFVVGGNGSGKTTMMKLLTGLYMPTGGEIRLNGEKLTADNLEWYRSNFSAVFSDFYLFNKLLGLENPLLGNAASKYLEKLHLSEKVTIENGKLSTIDLSQGQRKRLALLTSFLEDRNFYVLDEWAADQDPIFKQIFYKELLPDLKARGKTLLVITHDDRYYSLADRVVKLDYGRVSEINPEDYPAIEGTQTIKQLAESINDSQLPQIKGETVENDKVFSVKKESGFRYLIGGGVISTIFEGDDVEDKKVPILNGILQTALALLLIGLIGYVSLKILDPPPPAPSTLAENEFSSTRAFEHIKQIAAYPHPAGTSENRAVGDYIIKYVSNLGLTAEVMKSSTLENFGGEMRGGATENILVKIPGTEGKYQIGFAGHYDSTPGSPGASDDGAAVAAMLETMRAIKTGGIAHKNDLHFLFTDGEELTMLGARGIRDSSEYYKEIDVLFNFEARGSDGVSIMFETSPGNEWLVENLKSAVPETVATSISYDIYRYMPNLTDFTIFKENKIKGLNFAFIGNGKDYHNAMDSAENLSQSSLQHHGIYALNLAKYFGNIENIQTPPNNAVYFNLPGKFFVSYSGFWVLPEIVLGLLLLLAVIRLGLRNKSLKIKNLIIGFAAAFVLIIVPVVVSQLLLFILQTIYFYFGGTLQELSYNSHYQIAGIALLTVWIGGTLYGWFWTKIHWLNLFVGGLAVLWLFLLLSFFLFPGGSYLFFWSLLGGLVAAFIFVLGKNRESENWKNFAVSWLFAIPAIILFVPLIYLIAIALGINGGIGVAILVSLMTLAILPQLRMINHTAGWIFPVLFLGSALTFFGLSVIPPEQSTEHPEVQHIFYALNEDTHRAVWASADKGANEWTENFLTATPQKGKIIEYFPSNFEGYIYNPAPQTSPPANEIELIGESRENGKRQLRLKLHSKRNAAAIYLFAEANNPIEKLTAGKTVLNVKDFPPQNNWTIRKLLTFYAVPEEGLEITVETEPDKPLKLILMDQTYGLPPELTAQKSKPEDLIFSELPYNNSTMVCKSFVF